MIVQYVHCHGNVISGLWQAARNISLQMIRFRVELRDTNTNKHYNPSSAQSQSETLTSPPTRWRNNKEARSKLLNFRDVDLLTF